ncbi:MAG: peptidoglycan -binding protein [Pseudomonadota bacterium]
MLRARTQSKPMDIWPGFVDALSAILMVLIFLVMVFVIAQLFLRETLSGRDKALDALHTQVFTLTEELGLQTSRADSLHEKITIIQAELDKKAKANVDLQDTLTRLHAEVATLTETQTRLQDTNTTLQSELGARTQALQDTQIQAQNLAQELQAARTQITVDSDTISLQLEQLQQLRADITDLQQLRTSLQDELDEAQSLRNDFEQQSAEDRRRFIQATANAARLDTQLQALQEELATLSAQLDAAEVRDIEQKTQISLLGQQLNRALASKVQELAKYRSEFFGRLRSILGNRDDIKVVGDRFVFQSEVLFASGTATLGTGGTEELQELARALLELAQEIPEEINWVLQIEGHTDHQPISTAQFPSNWELSTARAISVVRALIALGVPPQRLSATGYGEFQPRDPARDEIARRRNRRIEIKLTQR